jgi:L,D-peptidoglycan transpeptidase YkuD (ErfK/YbiS/YcfS/YnhG family)
MLLVRADSWATSYGTLVQFERKAGGEWLAAGAEIPVDLGRYGMAWGRGLHVTPRTGPRKAEGDRKSPAGVFALARAFGTADGLPQAARGFPYLQSQASTYCVEDVRSKYYNQIIDSRDVPRSSWEKWSELRRSDGLFDWGVIVAHNAPDTRKAAGSCVFLHVWRGPRVPTAGCTALPREQIKAVVSWLDPAAEPVLVQLPRPVFETVRSAWGLPG